MKPCRLAREGAGSPQITISTKALWLNTRRSRSSNSASMLLTLATPLGVVYKSNTGRPSIACFTDRNALHCHALHLEDPMALAAERMKAMRERRRARGLRELRLIVPDARSKAVRRRIAKQVASLDRSRESETLGWIEAVSEFDAR